MSEIVTADIGGTHARFALAEISDDKVCALGTALTLEIAEHKSLAAAWNVFAQSIGRPLPRHAAIAVAGPTCGKLIHFTNSAWTIDRARLAVQLGVDDYMLLNDFSAIAHAVASFSSVEFEHLCGPDIALPATGVITVIGPGTGLGVAQLIRAEKSYSVIETEGGHIDFAPLDGTEDAILAHLRATFGRVSIERIASGPGLTNLYLALATLEERPLPERNAKALWGAALSGEDEFAVKALDRFCLSLGAIAGDIALAQGANAVVIAGGLGLKLTHHLKRSGFAERFVAKGRFGSLMRAIPVKLITHPQPGLYGAAAAFAARLASRNPVSVTKR